MECLWHLDNLEQVLLRLQQAGLKVNSTKSFFGRDKPEYLGYWITQEGIRPQSKKVEAINNLAVPKTQKQLPAFIGMLHYYRDIWLRRSQTLVPLTALTSSNVTVRNHESNHGSRNTSGIPGFHKEFHSHTDASDVQLGAVILQEGCQIAFFSRKLNPTQTHYTVMEQELLSIVEVLEEFRNIREEPRIKVYYLLTDLQEADIMTKPLAKFQFESLRKRLCGW